MSRTIRHPAVRVWALVAWATAAAPAAGQSHLAPSPRGAPLGAGAPPPPPSGAPDSVPGRAPRLALAVGGEAVPVGLDRTCAAPTDGRRLAVLAGALGVPVRGLWAWAGLSAHAAARIDCTSVGRPRPPGIYDDRIPEVPSGGFTSVDLRIAWTSSERGPWVVAAGGGWAAGSKRVPYVAASVGVRSPVRSARLGLDLGVRAYRVPWTARTTNVASDSEGAPLETVVAQRRYRAWAPSVGVAIVLEIGR